MSWKESSVTCIHVNICTQTSPMTSSCMWNMCKYMKHMSNIVFSDNTNLERNSDKGCHNSCIRVKD